MTDHEILRQEVVDEALGLLNAERRAEVSGHLDSCPACREEHAGVRRALAAADEDPAVRREPPVDWRGMAPRVWAEIDRRLAAPAHRPATARHWWRDAWAAAAAAVLVFVLVRERRETPGEPGVPAESLLQMERTVNREQTVRYLQDAQGVLVSVTTALPRCERVPGRREAGPEARMSRDLLSRRRLLVDGEAEHLAAARPLLEDVDHLLGRVASLDMCARPEELQEIARRIAQERLLMKMDLMARELMG